MKPIHWLSGAGIVLAMTVTPAKALQVPGPLVDVDWLSKHKNEVLILDVRKDTKSFTAKPKKKRAIAGMQGCGAKKGSGIHVAGHIPGANLVSWKKVRAKRKVDGVDLIKLVPTKNEMEALMQSHGVNKSSAVVIAMKGTKSKDVTFATRLYWQMKYWGHENVAVLDGGTAAWAASGHAVSRDKSKPATGNWSAKGPNTSISATTSQVEKSVSDGTQIIDARTEDFYLGTSQKDYVYGAGHIPNAKVFPHELIVKGKTAATFLPLNKLQALMKAKGIDPTASTVTYCDSGHLSTGQWFILHELLGNKNAKQYDGSMHEWTRYKKPTNSI
ncbi:MAG: sulfurtransferase [Gammaproteobacteria bacterium]|jgi:thiosulfate/3-mercaptopyruvate sulfurtransferase|nr:sulfurtransferase [Gammaproteobacteria bacterium]MBT3722900.1 sulfurtransferase [Gammaproteobacteria bacterium]MBT4076084.1 sulfurtransferase [Gammaproteobacteria bacterium]MBT4194428.1 sulfurtransferase [Gammaproteobacteria bacterium]MBT4450450.1 sulfurtransferase [Gammaproteobacteria bacterium]